MADLIQFLKDNFWHVAPILAVGVLAILIVFERLRALLLIYPLRNPNHFFEKIRDQVMNDRIAEAIAFCDLHKGKLIPYIVREALLRAHQPEVMIEDSIDIAISDASQKIQARTQFLSTIANVSTLLGLLGTILGLITAFGAVGAAAAQQRSQLLAEGISTAMWATMLGLAVAIPSMIAFSFLMNRSNRMNVQLEQTAVRILDLIRQRCYAGDMDTDNGHSRRDQNMARAV